MNVAVISNLETGQGKSSFIVLLASVFSRSQQRKVALFSTGNMHTLIESVNIKEAVTPAKSVSVFKAMLDACIQESEIYDYALRIGEEEVYLFNLFGSSMDKKELESMLLHTMGKVKADLTLIEVNGSLEDEFNKEVLKSADAIINIFNHNKPAIEAVRHYIEHYEPELVRRTGYVCQKYNSAAISEKKLGGLIKMNARNFMVLPYNPVIEKESIDGTLNTLARYIINGHSEVVDIRPKLLEVMQFLFDSPNHKYIRGYSEWHK